MEKNTSIANMTNEEAILALKQIKTYAAANLLDSIDYAVYVLQKLDELGIKKPLVELEKLKILSEKT